MENLTEDQRNKLNQQAENYSKTPCGFFIRNHRFSILVILAIVIFGGFAMFSLPRESEPEVEIPYGIVTTIYPGASPVDVENLITDKLEDEFKTLENVKEITSSSGIGVSSIAIEFSAEADLETSLRKLRDATDRATAKLPAEAEDPAVSEIRFSDIPIITFSMQGDFSQTELNTYSKILQDELESIPLVSKVQRLGNLKREFSVIVNKERLEGLNLSINSIVNAISVNNVNLPLGNIEIDNIKYNLRVEGEIADKDQLAQLPIEVRADGGVILLSDIAEIKDFFEDQETISRLSLNGQPSRNTVSLQIYKKTGGNILNIIKETKNRIANLQENKTFPANLNIITTNDNSQFVADDLNRLGSNAIATVIIIFVILFFVLGWREALIAGISIPLSFLSAFLFIKLQNQTLNSMVLFSLVLALGLLVDNIIVILEGIYDNINHKKLSPYQATLLAVKSFFWPVTSGTMTTVAAFLPLLLVSGIMGQYMGIIPKTVSAVLISALFISVTLIPAIAAKTLKANKLKKHEEEIQSFQNNGQGSYLTKLRRKIRDKFFYGIKNIKEKHLSLLTKTLPNKKTRRKYILTSWILFFLFISFPAVGLLKVEMFPEIDIDYFYINIETPQGSNLNTTNEVVEKVENIIYQTDYVKNFVTNVGTSMKVGGFDLGGGGANSYNQAALTVNLVDKKERPLSSYQIVSALRPKLEAITEAEVKIEEVAAGPPSSKPVEIRLVGEDIQYLGKLAAQVMTDLKTVEGAVNIEKSSSDATGEFVFYPKKEILAKYGLTSLTFASALRQQIYGVDASEVTLNNEDVKINVSLNTQQLSSLNDIDNLLINTPSGQKVPLSNLVEKNFEPSLLSISHEDGNRIISVTADNENRTAQEIFSDMKKITDNYDLPTGYRIEFGGENEDIQKSFTEIFLSFILAIILIATILVLQFNSFKQPLIILSTLPLALIGVFFGLVILRLQFSLPAFIGVVGLAGIVVNDAIILIDKINQNIYTEKMALIPGIIEAAQSRMQPIFLTTITTVAGILPLGLSDPMWAGLSFSIVFGLIFATFLTLIMVPIMYVSLEGKRVEKFFRGEVGRD